MRRLSKERRRWEIVRERKLVAYHRRHKHRCWRASISHSDGLVLLAPTAFAIDEPKHRAKLVDFLQALRRVVVGNRRNKVCIDFREPAQLFADGTLLFVAELRRVKQLVGRQVTLCCRPPQSRKVSQVFEQIGLYAFLGYRNRRARGIDKDVIHWRFATGQGADGAKYDEILGAYDGTIAPPLTSKLYVSLTEAMNNAHNHAHMAVRGDGLGVEDDIRQWWMFSQERDGHLHVVFCDLGVGIPETLPVKHPGVFKKLVAALTEPFPDARAIQAATKLYASRTGEEHRGRGLGQMVHAVTDSFHGSVCVHSNHGRYAFDGSRENLKNFGSSILGTIIAWRLPLPERLEKYHVQRDY